MEQELWRRAEELFHAALERPAEARRAFLDEACGEDAELRRQVELLVSKDEQAGSFLEKPVLAEVAAALSARGSLVGRQYGPYRILSLLGAGGMGEVYRAHDTKLGRDVAIKTLPPEFARDPARMARFRREAHTLASLNHPNIGAIYGLEESAEVDYLVLELVEGDTLHGPLPLAAALDYAAQVTEALQAAHEQGIIHRDLKPANLKVTGPASGRPGRVKVLDFGVAKAIWGTAGKPELSPTATEAGAGTVAGHIVGTPGYMSPEQARGAEVDQRTDIWAFGCLLYELLAGKRAFESETVSDTVAAVLEHEPDWQALPAETPVQVRDLLRRCLQKDANHRLNSIADARRALEELEVDLGRLKREADSGRSAAATAPVRRRVPRPVWAAGAAAVLLAALLVYLYVGHGQAIESLAVLPMINASADTSIEYLSDGITESLIDSLSQLPKLRVMSRSSVFRYKGRETDPKVVGRELKVQAVLVGRLVQRGENLSISAELVDARDNTHLWGEQYNRKLADVQAVQEDIGREITDKLRLKLTGEQKKSFARRQTQHTEAYQDYLKGRYYWNKRTAAGLRTAIEHFNAAIAKDPTFALAYAGLADCYVLLSTFAAVAPRECFPKARAAALKALEIDETIGEAHAVLAEVKALYDLDWAGAERGFKRAIGLNPGYATAHQWYGLYLARAGRFNEAFAEMKKAQELDPLSLIINSLVGWVFLQARRYDEAIEQLRQTLAMDPSFTFARFVLGRTYMEKRMHAEAIAEFRTGLGSAPEDSRYVAGLGHAYAVSGRQAEAQKILSESLARSKRGYFPSWTIATIYMGLGDKDRAFQWLGKAVEERGEDMAWLKVGPLWDPLRSDPRFSDLLRRLNLAP